MLEMFWFFFGVRPYSAEHETQEKGYQPYVGSTKSMYLGVWEWAVDGIQPEICISKSLVKVKNLRCYCNYPLVNW